MASKSIIGNDTGCNLQQELYCKAYTAWGTETFCKQEKSYIKAGYSPKNAANGASDLMKLPKIRKRIAELFQELCGELGLTFEFALAQVMHSLERARTGDTCTTAETSLVRTLVTLIAASKGVPVNEQPERIAQTPQQEKAGKAAAEAYKRIMARAGDDPEPVSNAIRELTAEVSTYE